MTINSIPQPAQPIAGGQRIDVTWYRFLRDLEAAARSSGVDLSTDLEAIARKLGSPDGSIAGIPEQGAASLRGSFPISVNGGVVSLTQFSPEVGGELLGLVTDAWGRVSASRPVVAGAGVVIDGTTNPEQIEIRSNATGTTSRITTDGDFRRTTQNDLRAA